jgi:hypothetical protein
MSSRVFVPFDNNPLEVSVKTASYTIPTGRFAKVYVECDSGGQFTINGNVAVKTDAFINIDVTATSGTLTYSVPTNYLASIAAAVVSSGTPNIYVNGNDYSLGMGEASGLEIGPGGSVSAHSSDFNADRGISGVLKPSNATHRQAEFFLPAGTIISGSGNWKAVVMEYNAIS